MQVGLHLSSFTWPGGPNALRAVGPPEQEMLEAYTALGAQARCPAPPLRRRRPRLRGDPKDGDRPARPRPAGEHVDELLESMRHLAALGITHYHGFVPEAASVQPLELLGQRVIPAAATF